MIINHRTGVPFTQDTETRQPSLGHLSDEQLVLFSRNEIPPPDRRRIENHLTQCDECLQRLIETEADDVLVSFMRETRATAASHQFDTPPRPTQDHSPDNLPRSDRYRLKQKIASGGMGEIWAADDLLLDREVALKIVSPENTSQAGPANDCYQRFEHESRIVATLQHPGIPPVYDLARLPDGRPFLAMKLVVGQTLRGCLEVECDRSGEWYLETFLQICQTLAFAHDRGITHRDLKPENIMVGQFGETQVMDWGIAEAHREPTDEPMARRIVGTPSYMSPEQALGLRCSPRSDVYSLGLILCEILTGVRGNRESNTIETLRQAMQGPRKKLKQSLRDMDVDEQLVDIAMRCIEFEPTRRPEHAGVLSDLLSDYFHSLQTRLHAAELENATRITREKEQSRRKFLRWSSSALAVCVLTVTGIAWNQHVSRHENLLRLLESADTKARTLHKAHRNSQGLAKAELTSASVAARQARLLAIESGSDDRIIDANNLIEELTDAQTAVERVEKLIADLDAALRFESRRTVQQNHEQRMRHRREKIANGFFRTELFLNKPSAGLLLTGIDGDSTDSPDVHAVPNHSRMQQGRKLAEQRLAFAFFEDVFQFSTIQQQNYAQAFAEFGIEPSNPLPDAAEIVLELKPEQRARAISGIRLWCLFAIDIGHPSALWIDELISTLDEASGVDAEALRWRRKAREAMMSRDAPQIASACAEGIATIGRQPEELAWGLGCFQAHFSAPGDTPFLEIAQSRFTESYVLNRELARPRGFSRLSTDTVPYIIAALAIIPDQSLMLHLGRIRLQQGRLEEFRMLRDRCVEECDDNGLILFEWGDAMAMHRQMPRMEVVETYQRSIREELPCPHFALARIGQIYFEMGEFQLARDYLLQADDSPNLSESESAELSAALDYLNHKIAELPIVARENSPGGRL